MPPVALFPELKNININAMPFSEDLVKGVTVLLMTATPLELRGIMGYLKPKDAKGKIIETYTDAEAGKIRFYIGKYGQYPVAVGMSGISEAGLLDKTSACNVTTRIMEAVKPYYLIAVGICRFYVRNKTSPGDVIVSNTLQADKRIYSVGDTLLKVFSSPLGYSHTQDDKEVKVHCGPIDSGLESVNPIYKKQYKELEPDILGYEIEGAGIMAAIENDTSKYEVEAIAIKAIHYWGDGEKSVIAAWKSFSSHAAARYVHHQMEKYSGTNTCIILYIMIEPHIKELSVHNKPYTHCSACACINNPPTTLTE